MNGMEKVQLQSSNNNKKGGESVRGRVFFHEHMWCISGSSLAEQQMTSFESLMPKGVSETIRLCDTHFGAVIACLRYYLDRQRGRQ